MGFGDDWTPQSSSENMTGFLGPLLGDFKYILKPSISSPQVSPKKTEGD